MPTCAAWSLAAGRQCKILLKIVDDQCVGVVAAQITCISRASNSAHFLTVKVTVNSMIDATIASIRAGLKASETIEWE